MTSFNPFTIVNASRADKLALRHADEIRRLFDGSATRGEDVHTRRAHRSKQNVKRMKQLKAGLANPTLGPRIIATVRLLDVDSGRQGATATTSEPSDVSLDGAATSQPAKGAMNGGHPTPPPEAATGTAAIGGAVRVVFLDRDDAAVLEGGASDSGPKAGAASSSPWWWTSLAAMAPGTTTSNSETPAAIPQLPTIFGVSAISLLMNPKLTVLTAGAERLGAFDAAGQAASKVLTAAGASTGLQAPLDRMSLAIHWWGYELALPPVTMRYLSTAHNVTNGFLSFLTTMAVSAAPEIVPFCRYISVYVDTEFRGIAAQDKGQGIIIAAIWAFPLVLVPRPWDFAPMAAVAVPKS